MACAAVNRLLESCCFLILLCFGLSCLHQVPSYVQCQSRAVVRTDRCPFSATVEVNVIETV